MNKEEIIKLLSNKYRIPRYAIKQIIEAPIRVICESLYKREMKGFIVPKLGKFVISPRKAKWIQEHILEKNLERDKITEELKLKKKSGN